MFLAPCVNYNKFTLIFVFFSLRITLTTLLATLYWQDIYQSRSSLTRETILLTFKVSLLFVALCKNDESYTSPLDEHFTISGSNECNSP